MVFSSLIFFKPGDARVFPWRGSGPLFARGGVRGYRRLAATLRAGEILPAFGIAWKAGALGDRIPVIADGVSNILAHLLPDAVCYSLGGKPVSSPTPSRIGAARSAIAILLER